MDFLDIGVNELIVVHFSIRVDLLLVYVLFVPDVEPESYQ